MATIVGLRETARREATVLKAFNRECRAATTAVEAALRYAQKATKTARLDETRQELAEARDELERMQQTLNAAWRRRGGRLETIEAIGRRE